MLKTFHVTLMNEDYSYQTQTLNGAKNIVIGHREEFTLSDLEEIIKSAEKVEKCKYGFRVFYRKNEKMYKLHTRDIFGEWSNETVKAKETALSHARKIYTPLNRTEQIKLF